MGPKAHPLLYHPKQTSIICLSTHCHHHSNIMWIVLVFLNKRGWWKALTEKHRRKSIGRKNTSLKLPKWTHLSSFKYYVNILSSFLNKRGSYGWFLQGPSAPSSLVHPKQTSIICLSTHCHHRSSILSLILVFLNKRGWWKASPEKNTSLKLPKWTQPSLMSSIKRVYQLTIESPKYERLDKGGLRPPSPPVSSNTNFDYMSINSLSSYKHYVNSLGFPK